MMDEPVPQYRHLVTPAGYWQRTLLLQANSDQKAETRGMFSEDGEYVDWNRPVVCDEPAEVWLKAVGKSISLNYQWLYRVHEIRKYDCD